MVNRGKSREIAGNRRKSQEIAGNSIAGGCQKTIEITLEVKFELFLEIFEVFKDRLL